MIDVTQIFKINCEAEFNEQLINVFRYQFQSNEVYRKWSLNFISDADEVKEIKHIPFLPIEFFKSEKVVCDGKDSFDEVFTSSSTTSQTPSRHYVKDISVYKTAFIKGFELHFGDPTSYCILALLPGYLDRQGSSLVYMCQSLIELSGHSKSGFYLRNIDELCEVIEFLKLKQQKTMLIGVSYALLDLAAKGVELNDNFIVMETGGMKGTRKEMLKEELHAELKKGFGINRIASEYGMTELLSQAYSHTDGEFVMPPWMRVLIRDVNDPLTYLAHGRTGGINVIDLANVYSCSFIATKDLGMMTDQGKLILRGRYDNSDIRGCNLMVQ